MNIIRRGKIEYRCVRVCEMEEKGRESKRNRENFELFGSDLNELSENRLLLPSVKFRFQRVA